MTRWRPIRFQSLWALRGTERGTRWAPQRPRCQAEGSECVSSSTLRAKCPNQRGYRHDASTARDPLTLGIGAESPGALRPRASGFLSLRSVRSEVQDQPEHSKARASERREKKGAVDHHRKVAGWASGTCLGCPCRTPDRFITKRPETALTDRPPTRRARYSSRIVPARPWVGMLRSGVDVRIIQVNTNDNLGRSRAVAPVSSAAF